jgi:hypothetical protein
MNRLLMVVSLLNLILFSPFTRVCHGQGAPTYYGYHPDSPLQFGRGFQPNDIQEPKKFPLNIINVIDDKTIKDANIKINIVTNATQLKEALNVDAQIDASFLKIKAGGIFNWDESSLYQSDTAMIVITARQEYGGKTIEYATLKESVKTHLKALIEAGKLDDFFNAYGTRVVTDARRGNSVSVIIAIQNITAEFRTKLAASAYARGGSFATNVDFRAAVRKEIQKKSQSKEIDVQFAATGGKGLGSTSRFIELLNSKDPLSKAEDALKGYLDDQKETYEENPNLYTEISFRTEPITHFFDDIPIPSPIYSEEKNRRLQTIVDEYRQLLPEIDELKLLRNNKHPRSVYFDRLTHQTIIDIDDDITRYYKYIAKLDDTHQACRKSMDLNDLNACNIPAPDDNMLIPSAFYPPYSSKVDVEVWHNPNKDWTYAALAPDNIDLSTNAPFKQQDNPKFPPNVDTTGQNGLVLIYVICPTCGGNKTDMGAFWWNPTDNIINIEDIGFSNKFLQNKLNPSIVNTKMQFLPKTLVLNPRRHWITAAQWIAPFSGDFKISGKFIAQAINGDREGYGGNVGILTHIYIGGYLHGNKDLTVKKQEYSFSYEKTLSKGDKVLLGASKLNNNASDDLVALNASIDYILPVDNKKADNHAKQSYP